MPAAKTTAAALDTWLGAARSAACVRVELLTSKGTVLASLPIAGELPVTGEALLELASDDAATDFGRRMYRARLYDGAGFREERRVVVDGGAANEEEAEESGSNRPTSERAIVASLVNQNESLVREMRCMFKVAGDTLKGAREAENVAREKWGELLSVQLSMATLTVERENARGELERKIARDKAIADQLGPSARALVGYLTTGKGVEVNDSVRKLFRSLMADTERAAQVVALLNKNEQIDLVAIGAFLDGEPKDKAAAAPAAPANGASEGS